MGTLSSLLAAIFSVLNKRNVTSSITNSLQLINQGNVQVNNRKVLLPNYICNSRDTISVKTEKGIRKFKLNEFHLKKSIFTINLIKIKKSLRFL